MKGGAHFAIGVCTAGFALWCLRETGAELSTATLVIGSAVAGAGALAPDIDHPGSTVSRRLPRRVAVHGWRLIVPVLALAFGAWLLGAQGAARGVLAALRPVLEIGVALLVPAVALGVLSRAISRTLGHRGATHSLLFALLAGCAVAALCARFGFDPRFGALFGLGWLTHLVADATGRRGVPALLWPLAGRS